jgi:hypothetical protein
MRERPRAADIFVFLASALRTLFLTLRCVIRAVCVLCSARGVKVHPPAATAAAGRASKKSRTGRQVEKGNSAVILGNLSFSFFYGRVFVFLPRFFPRQSCNLSGIMRRAHAVYCCWPAAAGRERLRLLRWMGTCMEIKSGSLR